MIRRWPTRALVVAGLVAATILLAATVDHQLTRDSLPEVGTFTLEHPASSDPAVAERERLRDGFITRAWLYSVGLIITVGLLLTAGLRAAPRERWHELFTDLGVAAVLALGLASAVSLSGPVLLDEASKAPIWLPPILMVVAAASGSALTRHGAGGEYPQQVRAGTRPAGPGPRRPPQWLGTGASRVGAIALALVALTSVLLLIGSGHDVRCGKPTPTWQGIVLLAAVSTGLAAGAVGIAALLARRWVVAMLSIPFPALAAVVAFVTVAGSCLS